MTTNFKVGDVVVFRAAFLRSVGWHTDVPERGTVTEVHEQPFPRVLVDWHDDHGPTGSASKNLILESEKHLEPV